MRIALICAEAEEIDFIYTLAGAPAMSKSGGVPVADVGVGNNELRVIMSGVGKANAAAAAQSAVSEFKCDVIMNVGLAGNCTSKLPLGGAVVAERLVYHDFSMRFAALHEPFMESYSPDKELSELAEKKLKELSIDCIKGTVATGDAFIDDSELKADIIKRTNCACVEMEAAAIAHIAEKNGVKYVMVKFMSDNADEEGFVLYKGTLTIGECRERAARLVYAMASEL